MGERASAADMAAIWSDQVEKKAEELRKTLFQVEERVLRLAEDVRRCIEAYDDGMKLVVRELDGAKPTPSEVRARMVDVAGTTVQRVQVKVLWALPNLGLDDLTKELQRLTEHVSRADHESDMAELEAAVLETKELAAARFGAELS